MSFRKKQYGSYQQQTCVFCGGIATQKNEQGAYVCRHHLKSIVPEQRCACGSILDLRNGSYGPYFHCVRCGNIPFKKAVTTTLPTVQQQIQKQKTTSQQKEITISTDDVEYFS